MVQLNNDNNFLVTQVPLLWFAIVSGNHLNIGYLLHHRVRCHEEIALNFDDHDVAQMRHGTIMKCRTPIEIAIYYGDLYPVKALLIKNPRLWGARNKYNETLLMQAVKHSQYGIVEYLCESEQSQINATRSVIAGPPFLTALQYTVTCSSEVYLKITEKILQTKKSHSQVAPQTFVDEDFKEFKRLVLSNLDSKRFPLIFIALAPEHLDNPTVQGIFHAFLGIFWYLVERRIENNNRYYKNRIANFHLIVNSLRASCTIETLNDCASKKPYHFTSKYLGHRAALLSICTDDSTLQAAFNIFEAYLNQFPVWIAQIQKKEKKAPELKLTESLPSTRAPEYLERLKEVTTHLLSSKSSEHKNTTHPGSFNFFQRFRRSGASSATTSRTSQPDVRQPSQPSDLFSL